MVQGVQWVQIRLIRLIRVRIETSRGQVFILVYRLAMDAKTRKCDGVAGRKYPSLLEGFPDGHIINGSYETSASTARGFYCFCLMTHRKDTSYGTLLPGRQYVRGWEVYPSLSPWRGW